MEAAVRSDGCMWSEYGEDEGEYPGNEEEVASAFTFLLGGGAEVNRRDRSPSPLLHDLIERKLINLLRRVLKTRRTHRTFMENAIVI